jgi:hypothetical protein
MWLRRVKSEAREAIEAIEAIEALDLPGRACSIASLASSTIMIRQPRMQATAYLICGHLPK